MPTYSFASPKENPIVSPIKITILSQFHSLESLYGLVSYPRITFAHGLLLPLLLADYSY